MHWCVYNFGTKFIFFESIMTVVYLFTSQGNYQILELRGVISILFKVVGHPPAEAKPIWLKLYIRNAIRLIGHLVNCLVLLHPTLAKPNRF